ncbi:hypothetical protein ABZP36_011720 [Zizania latifolia]
MRARAKNEMNTRADPPLVEITIPAAGGNREPCVLYKVPEQIYSLNPSEHEPSYVSIGPYHYRSGGLQVIRSNQWKRECVRHIESRLESQGRDPVLLDNRMKKIEDNVKRYYDIRSFRFAKIGNEDDPISYDSKAFCEMMKTDGCFILYTLGGLTVDDDSSESSSPSRSWNLWDTLFWWHDIVLYGNQIPFIVVRTIYQHIHQGHDDEADSDDDGDGDVLLWEIGQRIESTLRRYTMRTVTNPGNADHILHLCHELLKPTHTTTTGQQDQDGGSNVNNVGPWRRATEYHELLVKFKKRDLGDDDAQCITDIRVRGRVMEIPQLELFPDTWRLLRNLMLLEQMNNHLRDHVTAYCYFIWKLASTSEDVSLLVKKGIIVHGEATDKMAAKNLNMLCKDIINTNGDYLTPERHALETHCRSLLWRLGAKVFRYKDWKNPLILLGTFVAIVLLTSSILQVVYTMLPKIKHHIQN